MKDTLDPQILSRSQQGDPAAIESLVREHKDRVYRFCLSILDDADEAEDAAQESFIAALKALNSYRGESAFQTWLFSIALNTCRGALRQRKRRANLAAASAADPALGTGAASSNPEHEAMENEQTRTLWQAIARLDEKHRLPIVLRYYHELSTQEIADVLEINVGTVHSRLANARQQLNGHLKRTGAAQ